MSYRKYAKESFDPLMSLYLEQGWLLEKGAVFEKWFQSFDNSEHKSLIIDLLRRFTFIRSNHAEMLINDMLTHVFDRLNAPENQTQLVAAAPRSDPDSSHLMMQKVKPALAARGLRNVKLLTKIGDVRGNIEKYPFVVIIDDFVGTGNTMASRVESIKRDIAGHYKSINKPVPDFKVHVCVMAAMNESKDVVSCNDYYSSIWLSKGITDACEMPEAQEKINKMKDIEDLLDKNDCPDEEYRKNFPSLGWGGTESLYAMEGSNIPNSVFPIFWWPSLRDKTKNYASLFSRWG